MWKLGNNKIGESNFVFIVLKKLEKANKVNGKSYYTNSVSEEEDCDKVKQIHKLTKHKNWILVEKFGSWF